MSKSILQARCLKHGSYVPLMSFYKFFSGIFEKIFFSIFMAENEPLDVPKSFFADISKVKVLELNVVFSTNINYKHTHSGHFKLCLLFKLSMPFRSRNMINLPSSQIYRHAKLLFSPEKKQWYTCLIHLANKFSPDI